MGVVVGTGTISRLSISLHVAIAIMLFTVATITSCPVQQQSGRESVLPPQRIAEARRDPAWPPEGSVLAWGTATSATPFVVRDPLSEDNPYRGDYGEWDLWCYKHAHNDNAPEVKQYQDTDWPEEWEYLETSIDKDGWMLPVLQSALTLTYLNHGRHDLAESSLSRSGQIYGAAEMEPVLKERMIEAFATARAPFLLPVPQWLADAPPIAVMHLPDGRFVCLGEPGSGTGNDSFRFPSIDRRSDDHAWSVYSADGDLEATGKPGEYWWQLFITDFEERTGHAVDEVQCQTLYDRIIWFVPPNNEVGCISWDGSRAAVGTDFPDEKRVYDTRFLQVITGPELPYIYAAQQVTELIPPCGFGIGTTAITDLDLAAPIASATYFNGGATQYLQVKPLDDPDNPYAAWYQDWDFAIWDNHVKLCRDYLYNSRVLRGDYNTWDFQQILQDAGEGRADQGFWSKQLRVDDNGYVVPQVIAATPADPEPEIEAVIELNSRAGFYIDSPQFFDEEMEARIRLAWAENDALTLPTLPDWLVDNPPLKVILTPDGEYVTLGPLGAGATDPPSGTDAIFNQTGLAGSEPWYRYDADGNELGHLEAGDYWWELYFPGFDDEMSSQGYDGDTYRFVEHAGYIEVFEQGNQFYGNEIIYTYKGQRVNRRWQSDNPLEFHKINGIHLEAIRRVQREQGR